MTRESPNQPLLALDVFYSAVSIFIFEINTYEFVTAAISRINNNPLRNNTYFPPLFNYCQTNHLVHHFISFINLKPPTTTF